jgi:hypothetical protein
MALAVRRSGPVTAGEAIVQGIERRQPRIISPRRWIVMSVLRGVLNPLIDLGLERRESTQQTIRELDGRAGEDHRTGA